MDRRAATRGARKVAELEVRKEELVTKAVGTAVGLVAARMVALVTVRAGAVWTVERGAAKRGAKKVVAWVAAGATAAVLRAAELRVAVLRAAPVEGMALQTPAWQFWWLHGWCWQCCCGREQLRHPACSRLSPALSVQRQSQREGAAAGLCTSLDDASHSRGDRHRLHMHFGEESSEAALLHVPRWSS